MITTPHISTDHTLELWLRAIYAVLHAACMPIDDEENEGYFDGTSEYTDRDSDDEDEDDADKVIVDKDEDDLG